MKLHRQGHHNSHMAVHRAFHVTSQSCENHTIPHLGVQSIVAQNGAVCCDWIHPGHDKGISFYRIPKLITHRSQRDYELTNK